VKSGKYPRSGRAAEMEDSKYTKKSEERISGTRPYKRKRSSEGGRRVRPREMLVGC